MVATEIPEDSVLMTVEDFVDEVKSGAFTDDDGTGYFATPTQMVRALRAYCAPWLQSPSPELTHVVWFNK